MVVDSLLEQVRRLKDDGLDDFFSPSRESRSRSHLLITSTFWKRVR